MEKEVLFTERQKFKQGWLWLILMGINGLLILGVFKQVIGGEPFGSRPLSDSSLLMATGLSILLTLAIYSLRLETMITREGIYVRFLPFHFRFKHFSWDSLDKVYVRQYMPITEYGGWGLRLGLFGKGRAYNVSGDQGLQLEFNNNKKLLIGTNKPDEIRETLKKLEQLKQ